MTETQQDVFISHASGDKSMYIEPLAAALAERHVTFWLDSAEIAWGNNVTTKLNEGLRNSRFALVCLSEHFLNRPWPEQELSAALSLQNTDGTQRLLPLLLNSRERVFERYPLIAGMSVREFALPAIADEIARVVGRRGTTSAGTLHLVVASAHTGIAANLDVTPTHSIRWIVAKATAGFGLAERLNIGAFMMFTIRWVLVDVEVESLWRAKSVAEQQGIFAMVRPTGPEDGVGVCTDDHMNVGQLGVRDNTVFHLYAVQDTSVEHNVDFVKQPAPIPGFNLKLP